MRAREGLSRWWRCEVLTSMMGDHDDEHDGRCGRKRGAPDAIRARKAPGRTRTWSRRDDDTTLPRMTGDAGLLISTTTSESDPCAVT